MRRPVALAPTRGRPRNLPEVLRNGGLGAFTEVRRSVAEGKKLIELIQPRNEIRGEVKIWVSPEHDFLPVRFEFLPRERRVAPTCRCGTTTTRFGCVASGDMDDCIVFWQEAPIDHLCDNDRVEVDPSLGPTDFEIVFPAGDRGSTTTPAKSR